MSPVNVGDKPDPGTFCRVRLEGFSHHEGSLWGDGASENKIPQVVRTARSHLWGNSGPGWDPPPLSQVSPLLTRSEPPMPMLMTSVMALPEYPFHSPLRTRWHRAGRCHQPKPLSINCCSKASLLLCPHTLVPTSRPSERPTETSVTFLPLRQGLDPHHQLDPRPS